MTIVLLNTTPIVSKLVERLAKKRGDTLSEALPEDGGRADVVIVDESVTDRYGAEAAKQMGCYTLYIGLRFDAMPEGYDAVLGKPFLPDELDKALDDAELIVGGTADHNDIFDADEAAQTLETGPIFEQAEIDELKELLDAVEAEEAFNISENFASRESYDAAADDAEGSDEALEEVLYDAAELPELPEEDNAFDEIDLHARGVEALQDLMAILSDESVAKALKAMGVRIDISFGEKA